MKLEKKSFKMWCCDCDYIGEVEEFLNLKLLGYGFNVKSFICPKCGNYHYIEGAHPEW